MNTYKEGTILKILFRIFIYIQYIIKQKLYLIFMLIETCDDCGGWIQIHIKWMTSNFHGVFTFCKICCYSIGFFLYVSLYFSFFSFLFILSFTFSFLSLVFFFSPYSERLFRFSKFKFILRIKLSLYFRSRCLTSRSFAKNKVIRADHLLHPFFLQTML